MSLIYMKILEKKPESYDEEFHKLFPESQLIYEMIKERIGVQGHILEIGCGTGQLAVYLRKRGLKLTAVDISAEMIAYAKEKSITENVDIDFIQGDFVSYQIFNKLKNIGKFDVIISTFALSEFSPLRQKLFLKQTAQLLKESGTMFIAADSYPTSSFKKLVFSFKHFMNSQLSIMKNIVSTHPIKDFESLLTPFFSFKLLYEKSPIKFFECQPKLATEIRIKPISSFETVLGKHFKGLKVAWCILNGIFTRKSISPGLYTVGTPSPQSPLLITGNYYWTVWAVWRSLVKQNITCYVLIVDSSGINVWCAAGGKHFTHSQISDALRLFDVDEHVNHKEITLPQLSATGVDHKELKKQGWKPRFGPVYIDDLNSFLRSQKKEKNHAKVKFQFSFRTLMGLQHSFFILVTFFFPLMLLAAILMFFQVIGAVFWFNVILRLMALGIVLSMLFAWIYPLFNFTNSFFTKGVIFGLGSVITVIIYMVVQDPGISLPNLIFWIALTLLVSMFIGLDFAGNTPYTNHLDVESDLVLFSIPAIVLSVIALIVPALFPPIMYLF
ncbi:MAG: methyltransferase domain-containing protein [Promethearchaeota archaeon]